jgi:hypothetical protein
MVLGASPPSKPQNSDHVREAIFPAPNKLSRNVLFRPSPRPAWGRLLEVGVKSEKSAKSSIALLKKIISAPNAVTLRAPLSAGRNSAADGKEGLFQLVDKESLNRPPRLKLH